MMNAKAIVDAVHVPSILIALLPVPPVTVDMPNVANVDHITPLLIDRDVPAPSFGKDIREQHRQRARSDRTEGRMNVTLRIDMPNAAKGDKITPLLINIDVLDTFIRYRKHT